MTVKFLDGAFARRSAAAKNAPIAPAAKAAHARHMMMNDMRKRCGSKAENAPPLTSSQRSYLRAQTQSGSPAERNAARAMLEERR